MLSNLEHNVEINRKRLRDGSQTGDAPPPPADVAVRFLDWTDYSASLSQTSASPSPTTPAPKGSSPGSGAAGVASSSSPAQASACSKSDAGGGSAGVPGDGRPVDGCGGVSGRSRPSPAAAAAIGVETAEAERGTEDSLGMPEVVLAADVVYDVKYHPALVGVVVETLRRCPDALVVFASTVS